MNVLFHDTFLCRSFKLVMEIFLEIISNFFWKENLKKFN